MTPNETRDNAAELLLVEQERLFHLALRDAEHYESRFRDEHAEFGIDESPGYVAEVYREYRGVAGENHENNTSPAGPDDPGTVSYSSWTDRDGSTWMLRRLVRVNPDLAAANWQDASHGSADFSWSPQIVTPEFRIETPPPPRIVTPAGDAAPRSVGDFISTYTVWADVVEAPRALHEAFAIQLIASVLNRAKVFINWQAYKVSLDIWMVLLAGSGIGKNIIKGIGERVIDAAKIKNLIDNTDWGSKEAFYQKMSGITPGQCTVQSRLYFWEEIATQMKKFNSFAFDGVKTWLTNCYDNQKLPPDVAYSNTGRPTNTPPIRFDHAPRINILALSTEEWFFNNLFKDDATGGFTPRLTLIDAPGDRSIAIPDPPDPELIPDLASALEEITTLQGEVQFFDGFRDKQHGDYKKWYEPTKARFVAKSPSLGRIFWSRHRVLVLKLASVYEASMSRTLRVTPEAWERAVTKAAEIEATLFRLFNTGMTGAGYTMNQMETAIAAAGPSGLSGTEFSDRFKHEKDRKQFLETLMETGRVVRQYGASTGGRPPSRLIHRKWYNPNTEGDQG